MSIYASYEQGFCLTHYIDSSNYMKIHVMILNLDLEERREH